MIERYPIRRVCVYAASSDAVDPAFRELAGDLGRALAMAGYELVYGGGSVGLMGEVARAVLAAGGRVTGVIPHRLAEREIAFVEATELIRTETMRERKDAMDRRSDAFVVLPGGIGTLEELMEILTLKQLGYHDRPIVLLDADGFWQPLLALLDGMIRDGLAQPWLPEMWHRVTAPEAVCEVLAAYMPPPPRPLAIDAAEAVESPRGGNP